MARNDIIYLLRARIVGRWGMPKTVHKIGITDRTAAHRVKEIYESGGPKCSIVAQTKRGDAKAEETRFHRQFKEKRHRFRRKFNGSTEFFELSGSEAKQVARWMGLGFELTRIDEAFMWALFLAVIYAAL